MGCPTDTTTALANCLRVSDPKAVTLAYHLQLINLPCKSPGPRCGPLPTQGSPWLCWDTGVIARSVEAVLVSFRKGTIMTDLAVALPQAGAHCAE